MSLSQSELEAIAIAGCDRDPIHTPGHIQPFGCLLGLDQGCEQMLYASANLAGFLPVGADEALSTAPRQVLSGDVIHSIRNLQGRSTATTQRELVGNLQTSSGVRAVAAHVRNNTTIVEVAEEGDVPISQSEGLERLRWLTRKIDENLSLSDILDSAVRHLRTFSGYDRVKAYRFRPDGSGEVIAEDRCSDIESYLGLRFPEFDIPKQARQLYATTPIRLISDIDADPIGLVARPGTPPLDMSLAILRGTAPVHCDYLRNMGIRSSLSLPIVIDGKLWGLFAFHHRAPRFLGGGVSLAIEFAGQYLNVVIQSALKVAESRSELRAMKVANALFAHRDNEKASSLSWDLVKDDILSLVPANGAAFCDRSGCKMYRSCPPAHSIAQIGAALDAVNDRISISDHLVEKQLDTDLGGVAGALRVSIADDAAIYFFRNEASEEVTWAGSPEKILDTDAPKVRLAPRGSFDAFRMEMKGRSESWEPQDMIAADGLHRAVLHAYSESAERDALLENLALLIQELNHRVRNILALVKSIVQQSKPDDPGLRRYFEDLEARILSLASAHDLLTQNNSRSLDLSDAIKREAEPFLLDRVSMAGPTVGVSAKAATIFVLVLHELFSNAAKHGPLSTENGRLDVAWRRVEGGLEINWKEIGGPPVTPPKTFGFGQTLIRNALSFEFGGDADVVFEPDGLKVTLSLPNAVLHFDDFTSPAHMAAKQKHVSSVSPPIAGNVLVVEDDFIIATQIKSDIMALVASQVFAVSNTDDAIAILSQNDIGFAILDINLSGERSLDVARHLTERRVPFVFLTGYDDGENQLQEFPDVLVVRKPFQTSDLIAAISDILTS